MASLRPRFRGGERSGKRGVLGDRNTRSAKIHFKNALLHQVQDLWKIVRQSRQAIDILEYD